MSGKKIEVKGMPVTVISGQREDYLSLTDIARYKDNAHSDDLIRNWLRNRNILEFIGIWEQFNNPAFNPVEFDGIKSERLRLLNQTAIGQMTLLLSDRGGQRLTGRVDRSSIHDHIQLARVWGGG